MYLCKVKINWFLYCFFLGLSLSLLSCKDNNSIHTYLSGQIVNPKEKNIQLFLENKEFAKENLNFNNKFNFKLDSLKEGLYTFKHGEEFQYIYLEPNDSIALRLNTWDFDESLIFSGKGAIRNNFLMNLFLINEKQEKLFYKYYSLSEDDFLSKIDSLSNLKILFYKQFKENSLEKSSKFDALIQAAIYYPIYSQKERYAQYCNNQNKKLNANYYDFRKEIDIPNFSFRNFYAYRNYIKNYIQNKSFQIYKKDTTKVLSLIVLNEINTNITDELLKNEMLENAAINCVLDEKCAYTHKKNAIKLYCSKSSNKKRISQIQNIAKNMEVLRKGTPMASIKVLDYKGNSRTLSAKNTQQKTVIYFWPKEHNRIRYMAKRIHYLKKNHPNFRFIGINSFVDTYNWKSLIKSTNLEQKNQFQLIDKTDNKWSNNSIPRAIVLNKNGVIQNEFSFISQAKFENLLKF